MKRVVGIWPMEVRQGLGAKEMPLGGSMLGIPSLRDQPHNSIVQNRVYSVHGSVKRVVEAERERSRGVEAGHEHVGERWEGKWESKAARAQGQERPRERGGVKQLLL